MPYKISMGEDSSFSLSSRPQKLTHVASSAPKSAALLWLIIDISNGFPVILGVTKVIQGRASSMGPSMPLNCCVISVFELHYFLTSSSFSQCEVHLKVNGGFKKFIIMLVTQSIETFSKYLRSCGSIDFEERERDRKKRLWIAGIES